jgi:hypothetical protein
MVRGVILGLAVIFSPVMLEAQSLSPAAVIPTQFLWSHDTTYVRPVPATTESAEPPVVSCYMPVATGAAGSSTEREGGIATPPNRGVAIRTARSACRNTLDPRTVDTPSRPY